MAKAFEADYGDTKPQAGSFVLIPVGTKTLVKVVKAAPGVSTNDNPFVSVDYKIVQGEYEGKEVKWQNVTFLPKSHKYAGIALHALKCLLQPHQGKFKVNPDAWLGKYAWVTWGTEPGTKGPRNKVMRMDILTREEFAELGVTDLPDWVPSGESKVEKTQAGPAKIEPRQPIGPSADAVCEVCKKTYGMHGQASDHEFSEEVPF